jgi:hypothetical protein
MTDIFALDPKENEMVAEDARANAMTIENWQPPVGYLASQALGEAVVPTLLWFGICALAYQGSRKVRLSCKRAIVLFGCSLPTVAAFSFVLYYNDPHSALTSGFGWRDVSRGFYAPIIASLSALLLFGPSHAQPAIAARPARQLDTPGKRIAALVALTGGLICAGAFVAFEMSDHYVGFARALFDSPHRYVGFKLVMITGALLATLGGLFAFLYDETLGRIAAWTNTGTS